MTDLEKRNRYHRRRCLWAQQEPPKWRLLAWLWWLTRKPKP